jgi:hypothetical protein
MTGEPKPVPHERYTFSCPSDEYGQPDYLVDLEAANATGQCACLDFDIARTKRRREGEENLDKTQCKHIKRSLIKWAELEDHRNTLRPKREVLKWAREEIYRRVMAERRARRKQREARANKTA